MPLVRLWTFRGKSFDELKCLLFSQAVLRDTRSREGEFDIFESSLGGSELMNAMRRVRCRDGETSR